MTSDVTDMRVSPETVDQRLAFADAALGAAGHEVTDPVLREYSRQAAAGELPIEEAIRLGREHLDAR